MITTFSLAVTCLILVPTIPLVLYAIGLFLPSSHIVSRTTTYNTTAEILWAILTSVEDYPAWRSNIDRVTVRYDEFESEINKYEDESRLTFVEYIKKKDRRTVVMHIEQEKERKLLRVLEERPYIAPGEGEASNANSTFSGSWTFTIEPQGEHKVSLKITEQGVIKKPMVRVSYKLFFGYHRRIDRFLKDLGKEIDLGFLEAAAGDEEEEKEPLLEEEEEDEYEAGPDDSVIQPTPTALTESKILDKEWDMMSELYDKKAL